MTEQQQLLSIAQMAERHDVTLRTLRFYESEGLLAPRRAEMTKRGSITRTHAQRLYTESDSAKVGLIRSAASLGFTLKEIGEIVVPDGNGSWKIEVSPERASKQLEMMTERLTEIETSVDWLRSVANGAGRAAA